VARAAFSPCVPRRERARAAGGIRIEREETDRYSGPWWSKRAIRATYAAVRPSDVMAPVREGLFSNAAMDCSVGSKARSELAASSSSAAARGHGPRRLDEASAIHESLHCCVDATAVALLWGQTTFPANLRAIRVSRILEYKCSAPEIQRREREFRGDLLWPPEYRAPPSVGGLGHRGSLVAWAICAQAQEKPREPTKSDDKLQEVVITGSRIARPDLDRPRADHRGDRRTVR